MNILLVNDDGISSQGLALLCRTYANHGATVFVCAPKEQQSGKGHSMTLSAPIMYDETDMAGASKAYVIHGTPCDCTRIGLLALQKGKVDLVLSGINQGYNAGMDIFCSGTIGAAREATLHGIPAVALSAHPHTPLETLEYFAEYSLGVAEKYLEICGEAAKENEGSRRGFTPPVMSLNVPDLPVSQLKEPCFARLAGSESYSYDGCGYDLRISPRGQKYMWQNEYTHIFPVAPQTDYDLLQNGHITCTMLGHEAVTVDPERFKGVLE